MKAARSKSAFQASRGLGGDGRRFAKDGRRDLRRLFFNDSEMTTHVIHPILGQDPLPKRRCRRRCKTISLRRTAGDAALIFNDSEMTNHVICTILGQDPLPKRRCRRRWKTICLRRTVGDATFIFNDPEITKYGVCIILGLGLKHS